MCVFVYLSFLFLYSPRTYTLTHFTTYIHSLAHSLTHSLTPQQNKTKQNKQNILFLEHDLPANVSCVVALSGNDEILNSTSTYEYVLNCKKSNEFENKSPIDVILWPGFSHGQILMTPSEHKSFSHVVRQNNKSI